MDERPGFGDTEARRIIERAAQIDAEQGRQLDVSTLREIAAEAGISQVAVDRALQEHESKTPIRLPRRKRHPLLITLAGVVVVLILWVLLRSP